ncbi:NDP-hexose 2,3-dehydratase family protein [Streptomyces sp. NPDC001536]|uniref:NDP-hexose 2,3-dehydratase family protein n=1 Tax=Streptomyces sp. NPDC001536 TaxID=3364583 RepID=UPI0036C8E785
MPHVLVQARAEGGFFDVELGPTVQCQPESHTHLPAASQPHFLHLAMTAPRSRIRYSVLHSEEGGRFLESVSRYLIVETDECDAPLDAPPGFRWISRDQLPALTRYSHYVSVQARTLLLCLNTMEGA